MESRRPVALAGIDVDGLLEQRACGFDIAGLDRVNKRRRRQQQREDPQPARRYLVTGRVNRG